MIAVVADTSPLNYLVQLGQEGLLERLYEKVLIPDSVVMELKQDGAPGVIQKWARNLPAWIEIREVRTVLQRLSLIRLGRGERDAIELALATRAGLLLMDERLGTTAARELGLKTAGVLGVLSLCDRRGWIDARQALQDLTGSTNFRITRKVTADFLSGLSAG